MRDEEAVVTVKVMTEDGWKDAGIDPAAGKSKSVLQVLCPKEDLRVVMYVKDDAIFDDKGAKDIARKVEGWLEGGDKPEDRILFLTGIDRVEFYEMPGGMTK